VFTNPGTLEEVAGAQAGTEDKVPFQKGPGFLEYVEDFSVIGFHWGQGSGKGLH
jgi:hypothetical protein